MTGRRAGVLVAALGLASTWAGAEEICVIREGRVPGLGVQRLEAALVIEARKHNARWSVAARGPLDGCEGPRVVIRPDGVRIEDRGGAVEDVPLGDVDERSRDVAVAVGAMLAAIPEPVGGTPAPWLQARAPVEPALWGARAAEALGVTEALAEDGGDVSGFAALGGAWVLDALQSSSGGALRVEGGVALLSDRLALGLALDWAPSVSRNAEGADLDVTGVAGLATVRGRWRLRGQGAGALSAGGWVGVGVTWQRVTVRPEVSFREAEQDVTSALVEAGATLEVGVGGGVRVALDAALQGRPSWITLAWDGATLGDTSRLSVAAGLRVIASFGAAP